MHHSFPARKLGRVFCPTAGAQQPFSKGEIWSIIIFIITRLYLYFQFKSYSQIEGPSSSFLAPWTALLLS